MKIQHGADELAISSSSWRCNLKGTNINESVRKIQHVHHLQAKLTTRAKLAEESKVSAAGDEKLAKEPTPSAEPVAPDPANVVTINVAIVTRRSMRFEVSLCEKKMEQNGF